MKQFAAVLLVGVAVAALYFKVDYAGWVLFAGILAVIGAF
jgi:hypothetical protein